MCFVNQKLPASTDPQAGADEAQTEEVNRRRRAQGYGATLLNNPSGFGAPQLGRNTLGGT